jgi:hypothetical protein
MSWSALKFEIEEYELERDKKRKNDAAELTENCKRRPTTSLCPGNVTTSRTKTRLRFFIHGAIPISVREPGKTDQRLS